VVVAGFGTVEVAARANWVLAGDGSVAAGDGFTNDGRVTLGVSDTLTLGSGVAGTGVLVLSSSATAVIDGAVSAGETLVFSNHGLLALDSPETFLGTLSHLGANGTDRLELAGFGTGTSFIFTENGADTGGTLSVTDGGQHASIALLGQFVATGFQAAISASYTIFTYATPPAAAPHLAAPG
jgi:hypothetical protein